MSQPNHHAPEKPLRYVVWVMIWWICCIQQDILGAPKPKETAPLLVRDFQNAFNKSFLSKEFEVILKKLPPEPIVFFGEKILDDDPFYFIWKEVGISMLIDEHNKFKTVFFHAGDGKKTSTYPGELPHGLSFSDTQADIKNKIKITFAEESYTLDEITTTDWRYPELGLRISFLSTNKSKPSIDSIGFFSPEK